MKSCPIIDFLTKYHLLPYSNDQHFSSNGARTLSLDPMSSSFHAVSESHLICWIWCNRRIMLTYVCNHVELQIFIPNNLYPFIFQMLTISQYMVLWWWDWTQCLNLFKLFQIHIYFATGVLFWLRYANSQNSLSLFLLSSDLKHVCLVVTLWMRLKMVTIAYLFLYIYFAI